MGIRFTFKRPDLVLFVLWCVRFCVYNISHEDIKRTDLVVMEVHLLPGGVPRDRVRENVADEAVGHQTPAIVLRTLIPSLGS